MAQVHFVKHVSGTLAVLLAAVSTAAALPRTAVVRVADIYRELESTEIVQRETAEARQSLIDNERAEVMRTAMQELEALEGNIRRENIAGSPEALRDFDSKRQEVRVLQEEFERFRSEEERRINREMVDAVKASLTRIAEVAATLAADRGYEILFDASGNSNTGLPVLIHAKNADDLTADVMIRLRDLHGERTAEEARAAAASADAPTDAPPPPTPEQP